MISCNADPAVSTNISDKVILIGFNGIYFDDYLLLGNDQFL